MSNINLLPWREAQRQERNKATFVMCVAIWAFAVVLVFLGKLVMDSRVDNQNARNAFLQTEIAQLSKVIEEIEDLKEQRDRLLARMEVIQRLQANRSQIVHVFDDLVSKLPSGVIYNSISKSAGRLNIEGVAQSNNRVSDLMRNLDSSEWFENTSLKVVDIVDQNGLTVSKFDVDVLEETSNRSDDQIENIE